MKITEFETWWVSRQQCLFDKKRQGGASMDWDVLVIRLGTDEGIDGIATCLAARSGAVTEAYLYDNIAPVIMGRDPHDREAIWHELWNIDRHLTFFPVYLPGPVSFDKQVHQALRDALGDNYVLMSDPVGEYTMGDAIAVGRQLEQLGYQWLEEPFRDFELYKYTELCRTLDIPVAASETTRGAHWGVAQVIAQRAADIVRADVSWKDGITGTLKIAHLAESFGINCEIHTTTMNYMDLVNLHVSCAIRNCEYFEYFVPEDNYRLPMKGNLPIENGIITVPETPGIGAELDWELIEKACRSHRILNL